MQPASGKQWEIHRGSHWAVVVEVGGGLREYVVDGVPVLDPYPLDRMADGARGQPLIPWPNRLADGQYTFAGQALQLPIDEPQRHNASHGLTRWVNWSLIDRSVDQIRVGLIQRPRPGYPFTLQVQIQYQLVEGGLTVRTSATNLGSSALPFGAGQHPYFTAGTALIDPCTLRLPATNRLELDPERRLPTGRTLPVQSSEFDFRKPRRIGSLVLDECFCDLTRDADGRARAILAAPNNGRSVSVWLDQRYKYLQVFSGDTLVADRRRRGLAIEPMTCPPNAFRSGTDVLELASGDTIECDWGIGVDNRLTGT